MKNAFHLDYRLALWMELGKRSKSIINGNNRERLGFNFSPLKTRVLFSDGPYMAVAPRKQNSTNVPEHKKKANKVK
jgi:hypothetical protein